MFKNHNDDAEEDWEKFVGTYKPAEVAPSVPSNANPNSIANFNLNNFEHEEFVEILNFFGCGHLAKQLKPDNKSPNLPNLLALPAPEQEGNNIQNEDKNMNLPTIDENNVDMGPNNIKLSPLICLFKTPEVIWQQNETFVVLSIKLGDTEAYYLEITEQDLILEFKSDPVDEEPRVLLLNFYAAIDTRLASYEKPGLNLIVRLPKLFKGINWLQLQATDEKFAYIKYNYDALIILDEYCENARTRTRPNLSDSEMGDDFDSSSNEFPDDDDEKDEFDPLEDGFG